MGLARDLVELEGHLRSRVEIDPFAPIEQSGLLTLVECSEVIPRFRQSDPASILRVCLQALRIQYDELRPRLLDAELVATLPRETPGFARPTERVVHDMVNGAA